MARVLEFDRELALDKAMTIFWQQGYADASVQDLLDAMQINRGSLYATFGTKEDLYKEALQRYEGLTLVLVDELLQGSHDPRAALEQFFKLLVIDLTKAQRQSGCFLVNTIVETVNTAPVLSKKAAATLKKVRFSIEQLLLNAQEKGSLSKDKDAHALALFFQNTMNGLRVSAQQNYTPADLELVLQGALKVLD